MLLLIHAKITVLNHVSKTILVNRNHSLSVNHMALISSDFRGEWLQHSIRHANWFSTNYRFYMILHVKITNFRNFPFFEAPAVPIPIVKYAFPAAATSVSAIVNWSPGNVTFYIISHCNLSSITSHPRHIHVTSHHITSHHIKFTYMITKSHCIRSMKHLQLFKVPRNTE